MAQQTIPRHTFLPPPGRPRWQTKQRQDSELAYLSWGVRWMGNHPIPLARHEGWVYLVVLDGKPQILLRNRKITARRGDVFIMHPDCAYGCSDKRDVSCKLVTWLWLTSPSHTLLAPKSGAYVHLKIRETALRQIAGIHKECQLEVGQLDETARLALRRAHLDLDLCLVRAAMHRPVKINQKQLIKMALRHLSENRADLHSVKSLCEHLQIAPSTLRNLFNKQCGKSLRAVALEMRMKRARERLKTGSVSVKEVALELGYSHPNDFCRAYKRHFGQPAIRETKVA